MSKATETPLMQQYREIKGRHQDAILFFRMGDFYETFDEDAETVARELEITLTSRPVSKGQRVPLAGHSRASDEAANARQNNSSELRAVKRMTIRTPSTSNCRIDAIHRLSAIRLRVRTASSRQPSNQF